ncbi:MAG: APC family permease [Fimbriimonadales bacterium]|nr:APC family permease [Fimbriimonadales bacterium]
MSLISRIRRVLVGPPIATKHAHHERLPKIFGLPVFASDALSSVAYATEEVLLVLALAGAAALYLLMPVSYALGALMLIVGFSYYQTIHAYPKGGGTYLVSTENLGSWPGRVAGAALLIDYVLTVAVSISSGTAAIYSAFPQLQPYKVLIAVAAVTVIGLVNLRGARESGIVFALPTYTFVFCVLMVVGAAILRSFSEPSHAPPAKLPTQPEDHLWLIGPMLVLRAFAASCTALTGTEAIADGVQAFRPPEAKNAGQTLFMMIALMLTMFLGISWTAHYYGIVPMSTSQPGYMTVLAQMGAKLYGEGSWFFYLLQGATALILFLAANTAFADFPRLSSFIARDKFLPRQLMNVGDRLVFQNGIILLALVAILLLVLYHADTHSLIPLYALGVFISFTLSQAGMTIKWIREGVHDYRMFISGFGALVTFSVAIILLVTKFEEGAWMVTVAIGGLLFLFAKIRKYYDFLQREFEVSPQDRIEPVRTTALLLVPRLHKGTLKAIAYSQSLTDDCRALHVTLDPTSAEEIKREWDRLGVDMPLVILESPYRSLIEPVLEYIDQAIEDDPEAMITVIVPQGVPPKWYQALLHSNVAALLKLALGSRRNVVITNVRYFLS